MTDPILRVEHVSLRRNARNLLQDVNLTVYPGQIHTLLGLNGSGKSTLAYTLMGCDGYSPDAGRILFAGEEITHLSITARARLGLTLAWQEPARFEGIPVGKYVSLGQQTAGRQTTVEALEAVALNAKAYGYRAADATLSGGERKRVELAAVYAMRPKLAILDEPDSGIDVLSLGEIEKLIRDLAAQGSAVLLITHRDELAAMADTASIMCYGAVLFTGDPEQARSYFTGRCRPHLETLGSQPWDRAVEDIRAEMEREGFFLKDQG